MEKVEKKDESNFRVWVKEAPVKGRANEKVIELLSNYFQIPKLEIKIIFGEFSPNKIIEICG
ncbi:MAG: DUF167 domain-containing protein [bacterium]